MSTVTSVTKCTAPAALMLLLNAAEPVAAAKCFQVFQDRLSWEEANNQCGLIEGSTNGKLAQILSLVVQTTVAEAITASGPEALVEGDKHDGYWVGARTRDNEQSDYAEWVWIDGVAMYEQEGHTNGGGINGQYNNWMQDPKMPDRDTFRVQNHDYQTCMQMIVNWDSDNTNARLARNFQWDNYWCNANPRRFVCEYDATDCSSCPSACLPDGCDAADSVFINEGVPRCCTEISDAVTYDANCKPASCKQDADAGEFFVVNDATQPETCCQDMNFAGSFYENCTLKECDAGAARTTVDTCCPAIEHAMTINVDCLAEDCDTGYQLNNDNTACCATAGHEGVLTFGAECAVLACKDGDWVPNTPEYTAETATCCQKVTGVTKYDEECNPNTCEDGKEPNVPLSAICCSIKENVKTHTEACVPDTCEEGFTLDVPASATGCCPPVDNAETYGSDCAVATCNFGFVRNDGRTGCVVPSADPNGGRGNCPIIAHAVTYTATCSVKTCEEGFKVSADATSCEAPLPVVASGSGEEDGFNPLWLLLLLLIPCLAIPAVVLFLRRKNQAGKGKGTHAFMDTPNTDDAILDVKVESEKVASVPQEEDAPATGNAEENGAGEQDEDDVFDL